MCLALLFEQLKKYVSMNLSSAIFLLWVGKVTWPLFIYSTNNSWGLNSAPGSVVHSRCRTAWNAQPQLCLVQCRRDNHWKHHHRGAKSCKKRGMGAIECRRLKLHSESRMRNRYLAELWKMSRSKATKEWRELPLDISAWLFNRRLSLFFFSLHNIFFFFFFTFFKLFF